MYIISYSATIVALLQSPSSKIKTLDDLLSSRLKFGVDDTVFNRYYFSVSWTAIECLYSSNFTLIVSVASNRAYKTCHIRTKGPEPRWFHDAVPTRAGRQ